MLVTVLEGGRTVLGAVPEVVRVMLIGNLWVDSSLEERRMEDLPA